MSSSGKGILLSSLDAASRQSVTTELTLQKAILEATSFPRMVRPDRGDGIRMCVDDFKRDSVQYSTVLGYPVWAVVHRLGVGSH